MTNNPTSMSYQEYQDYLQWQKLKRRNTEHLNRLKNLPDEEIPKQKPKQKPINPTLILLALGILFIVLNKIHWAFVIVGVIFILVSGWMFYNDYIKSKM